MRESRHRTAVSPSPRERASGWVLEALFPNGRHATIAGFGTEAEANDWLGSARHIAWLRDTRSAFSMRAVVAIFEYVSAYAAVLAAAASECFQSARQRWRDTKQARREDRTTGAALALLLGLRLACISGLAEVAGKWVSAARTWPVCWRSIFYRCLFAVSAILLIVTAVVAILAAVLAPLGRNEPRSGLAPGTPPVNAARPIETARSVEVPQVSDPIALLMDRVSASDAETEPPTEVAAEEAPPQRAAHDGAEAEVPVATPRHDVQRAAPPGIAGVWAPDKGSCSARNAREGGLPAVISERGARAGQTSCIFKNQRRTKSDWRLLANCRNGHERWSSNVRLAVKSNRLIWTSERGTQAYVRCRS